MKKNRTSIILLTSVILVLVTITAVLSGCGGVDKEYEYNTEIIANENAPVNGSPEIDKLTGYVEDKEQDFVELPYAIEDTSLEVISIGSYTGPYVENGATEEVEDVLAIVVKNTSDKVVSYSSITVEYAEGTACSFSPTNIPSNQSALVFTNMETVPYKDVTSFVRTDSMEVLADSLPMLEDKVGIDFKDGKFIVTNLTNENLGDVYIRYKTISDGNAYLGGITYSVVVSNVEPYETYKVDAENYDVENSMIIAVENVTP